MAIALEVPVESAVVLEAQPDKQDLARDSVVDDPNSPKDGALRSLRWTWDEYLRLTEERFFEGRRVQLIEGEIIEMAAQNAPHASALGLVEEALRRVFMQGFIIYTQRPLRLADGSAPEPDVAVVRGTWRDYKKDLPVKAALVVEVSVSTLNYDRTQKVSLYAKAGIEEYWLLNVEARQLEAYRRPIAQVEMPFGFGYAERRILGESEDVESLAAPGSPVSVKDLLP